MNTNYLATLGTGPPFLFVSNDLPYANLLYVHEIVNHTHTILGSIAFIQVIQPVARKAVTVEAVPDFTSHYLLAVFDSTRDSGF
jgi:hypothetical protein